MGEPVTKAARHAMSNKLRHTAYCVVQVGWDRVMEHPDECVCELLPDVLGIETEAAAQAVEVLREKAQRWHEEGMLVGESWAAVTALFTVVSIERIGDGPNDGATAASAVTPSDGQP